MRVVHIEGRDLELVRALLLGELINETTRVLEVGLDTEGVKFRIAGHWTPGYGQLQPTYRVVND